MTKVIRIESRGFVWHIPLSFIADHRAKYYAERDEDTTYQEEYDYVMEDHFEGIDWYHNNMDFEEAEVVAALVKTPEPLTKPDPQDYEADLIEVQP